MAVKEPLVLIAVDPSCEFNFFISGLTQHSVHDTTECEALMEKGWGNRSTGATLMNQDSSRSHSIFTITMEMLDITGNADSIRTGKLNLVDLAGSERQAKTGKSYRIDLSLIRTLFIQYNCVCV